MRSFLLSMVFSIASAYGAAPLNVSLCNYAGVGRHSIAQARREAEIIFAAAGVSLVWQDCADFESVRIPAGERWFVVRLLADGSHWQPGPLSLDTMGRAFVDDNRKGAISDAYMHSIAGFANWFGDDQGSVLGFVVAHELGHLLLGPGHSAEGLMRPAWGEKEFQALRKRWLRFSKSDARRVGRASACSGLQSAR